MSVMGFISFKGAFRQRGAQARARGRFSPLGLDIGSACIKLVQLEQIAAGPPRCRWAACPAPKGLLKNSRADSAALTEALQGLIKSGGFNQGPVHIGLPGQAATVRRITLPPLSPRDVAKAMRWEAAKHLPLPAEEAVYDYAFLEKRVSEEKTVLELILAAAPKALTETLAGAVTQAGLSPEAIEATPFALSRAVQWCAAAEPKPFQDTLLVIYVGARSSDLLVLHRGVIRFFRPVAIGVNHFRQEGTRTGKHPPGEAAALQRIAEPLLPYGPSNPAQKLTRQAARSLEFFISENDYPEHHCGAVLLCGGGALIPGLTETLAAELDLETVPFNPLSPPYACPSPGESPAGPLYSAAFGLAVRGWAC